MTNVPMACFCHWTGFRAGYLKRPNHPALIVWRRTETGGSASLVLAYEVGSDHGSGILDRPQELSLPSAAAAFGGQASRETLPCLRLTSTLEPKARPWRHRNH